LSNETEVKEVSLAEILGAFHEHWDDKSPDVTLEEITEQNQKMTEKNAGEITSMTNDAIAAIKELVNLIPSAEGGADQGVKAIDLVNQLSKGCHRMNRNNAKMTDAANNFKQQIDDLNEELESKQKSLNLATLLVGVRQVQAVQNDPELMEGLQIG
jgi:hypothetical protein